MTPDVATRAPRRTRVDRLAVEVHATRAEMGAAAAAACARRIRDVVAAKGACRMIFAAAPSQNELLAGLCADPGIPWGRVEAFHMDEYVGLPEGSPARFSQFLRRALFDRVPIGTVHLIEVAGGAVDETIRGYEALLDRAPVDIVCLGVGENGHIAFNDPPVADFDDPRRVKEVALDRACRAQQVHDGAFPTFDAVPAHAITLTVPALMRGGALFCVVPGPTKAAAVERMLTGPIATSCPASVLRTHPDCTLYLDEDSAARWLASRGEPDRR